MIRKTGVSGRYLPTDQERSTKTVQTDTPVLFTVGVISQYWRLSRWYPITLYTFILDLTHTFMQPTY